MGNYATHNLGFIRFNYVDGSKPHPVSVLPGNVLLEHSSNFPHSSFCLDRCVLVIWEHLGSIFSHPTALPPGVVPPTLTSLLSHCNTVTSCRSTNWVPMPLNNMKLKTRMALGPKLVGPITLLFVGYTRHSSMQDCCSQFQARVTTH